MSEFEEQLATALIAKMAGSNLMEIDQHTVKHSNLGPAARIDPTSFLTNIHQKKEQQKQEEVLRLNALAEQKFPIPPPIPLIDPLPPIEHPPKTQMITNQEQFEKDVSSVVISEKIVDVLNEINNTLKELVKSVIDLKDNKDV